MSPVRREALVLAGAGLAAAAAGFLAGPLLLGRGEGIADLGNAGLLDPAGKPRRLTEWEGRVLVCNFWATWCAPCREEIPLLIATRARYRAAGVEIIGIAIDIAAKVLEFTRSFNVSYPILVADSTGMELMRRLGNQSGGLPYTVFFDRQGRASHRKLGALSQGELETILGRLTAGKIPRFA